MENQEKENLNGLENTEKEAVEFPPPVVSIVMGSKSDLAIMEDAAKILREFDIPYEMTIVSAHRTPLRLVGYGQTAREKGIKVIIAGAGGAAHLPGMMASLTTIPVIGVPIKSSNSIDGWDSILSILQMPNGVPVATVALNAAKNAGLLATQILSIFDNKLRDKLAKFRHNMVKKVEKDIDALHREEDERQFV